MHGAVTLCVELGSWSTEHVFVVADIHTNPIIGADFLASERMTVNLDTNQLLWGSRRLRLLVDGVQFVRCQVILKEDTAIAGAHRIITTALVTDHYEEDLAAGDTDPSQTTAISRPPRHIRPPVWFQEYETDFNIPTT